MSRVKNVSGGPLDVPLLARVVEADEIVEVPDFQPGHGPQDKPADPRIPFEEMPVAWPPPKWEPVADKAAKPVAVKPAKAAAKADDASAKGM